MKALKGIIAAAALLVFTTGAFAQGGKNYIINHFVADASVVEAHLVITDVEGNGPVVNLSFYDGKGKLVGSGKEVIQPFGKLNLDPTKYVKGTVNGTVHIASTGGNVVAEYWQFYKKDADSWKNTTTTGFEKPGFTKLVCPHFVADQSVEAYIVIANTGSSDATVDLKFYDDDGNEVGKRRELVEGNGKVILKPTDYVSKKTTGVVHITASGGRVTGEYWQAEGSKKYQLAVPMGGS